MTPIPVNGPAVEPVSIADMRAYLRLDHSAEDDLVAGLIKAARLLVEATARRALVAQRWRVLLDRWPGDRAVRLPISPLLSVERVSVTLAPGQTMELPASAYTADAASDPPRVVVEPAAPVPGVERGGIAIELTAGYGTAPEDVPEPLRLAIQRLVARWFENRGDVVGEQRLPPEDLALVAPYQRPRL